MSDSSHVFHEHRKNLEIERLRAIAGIMVTGTHGLFLHIFPTFMRQSFIGVDLFFAISGFVVTLAFLRIVRITMTNAGSLEDRLSKSVIALKTFYIRRVCRILPLAFTWMLIYF